jgi:thiol-disulfide isomerase/thioredoxin
MWRRAIVAVSVLGLWIASAARAADTKEAVEQINQLLVAGKLDEASQQLTASLKDHPEAAELQRLNLALGLRLEAAGNHARAAEHLDQYYGYMFAVGQARGGVPPATYLERMANAYAKAGDLEKAIARVNHYLEAARAAGLSTEDIERAKVILLAQNDRDGEAAEIVRAINDHANQLFAQNPNSIESVQTKARALRLNRDYLENAQSDQAQSAGEEYQSFLKEQSQKHKDNPAIVGLYVSDAIMRLARTSGSDPEAAAQELATVKEFLDSLAGDNEQLQAQANGYKRSLASIESRIEAARKHNALLGTEALPIEAVAWVNGSRTADELQGKVILVDFWAVWCGPCIATFPHLREWYDKYHEQGFEIVGVTRYYSYGWDEEAQRPKREQTISPEDEQAAMAKFAEHHELKHPLAVVAPDSPLYQAYGVRGIPQAVLIDQEGKVRMIRVGSGDANAHDLEAMIEQLLGNKE